MNQKSQFTVRTNIYFTANNDSVLFIFITLGAAEHIRKINSNGVKKMCRNIFAVQHTLTSNITGSRETSLDHAKQYYEMFNQRQQEVLNSIVEKGPTFSAEEYSAAIQLLHRYALSIYYLLENLMGSDNRL